MCGIVGLLVKNPELRAQLGELMLPMLIGMSERGPESAGLAVFTEAVGAGRRKFSVYSGSATVHWAAFTQEAIRELGADTAVSVQANHAVLETAAVPQQVKAWLTKSYPHYHLLSVGQSIDLYKDTGTPGEVAARYAFSGLQGSHLVGHTRMATETAVTPERAHPFTAGEDFCLVHNGSLSNPYSVRRKLEPLGIKFETDNDTEAACRFIEWRMQQGETLDQALHTAFQELDGFYTLLIATNDQMTLVRDAFACKPAVVAETDAYVAIASEFRSLAHLPDVANANIFEPLPEVIHSWTV